MHMKHLHGQSKYGKYLSAKINYQKIFIHLCEEGNIFKLKGMGLDILLILKHGEM